MNPSINARPILRRLRPVIIGAIVSVTLLSNFVTPAFGQRRRLEVDLLSQSEIRGEIGLTEQESAQIAEILKSSTPDSDFFKPYLEKLKEAGDDKELQNSIRKEMFAKREEMTQQGKAKAVDALSPEQKAKLRGLFLESAGMRAFTDERVAKEYGIDEEQAKKIAEVESAHRSAERGMADDASDDDWNKFDAEWDGKFMAVLNPQQQTLYKSQALAKVAAPTAIADSAGTSGGADSGSAMQQVAGESTGSFGSATKGESKLVESFSFNFRNELWERVLQMYADGAGLTLDLNQVPPGTFSHYDDNSYSQKKTLDILNGYLNRKGFVMIEKDGFLSVMNTDNGIPPYLIRDVTDEQLLKVGPELEVGENELANFKIDVDGMDAAKVAQEIEAVLGPLGSMVALTESKVLILTDVGSNLRRIRGFLVDAQAKAKPDTLIFKSYFLTNMDAEEAEIQVMTQFGMRQNVQNVSAVNDFNSRSRSRTGAPQTQTRPTPTPTTAAAGPAIQIATDLRLNSLLVTGTAVQHELVETILAALDVSEGPGGEKLTRGRKGTYLEVYQVNNSDATEVTKTLTAMNIPGVTVVNEDGRNGRIHIMATERQHEEVAMLVRQLDGSGSTGSVAVIPLTKMDPLSAAATLRSLFYADGDSAPTIETDLYGRRLIIRGDIEAITQIRAVLADLGEDGTGLRPQGNGDLVRRFSLQGRNPQQFLQVLQQQWESQQGTKINIVIPGDDSPIRSRRTPGEEFEGDAVEDASKTKPESGNWDPSKPKASKDNVSQWGWKPANGSAVSTWQTAAVQENNVAAKAAPAAPVASQGGGKKSDIIVQLMGDELLLVADDPSQLDELETLLDMLQQSLPMKAEWTVVYLELADATEAADMLSQFFPSSSVSSPIGATGGSMLGGLGASLGGMGSNLMDATGLSGLGMTSATLRIIPDIRTNSLFMTGPQSMINDALSFLQVLDSNDVPNSLKDMQPRQIAVKYADVDAVAGLVRDVFKPYLEAPPQQKGQQANPLAMMFGGGGGAAGGSASGIRMTLGVDTNTSILTINSDQEIYDEVESVVLQMDDAAKAAKPTVRSVVLHNTDAAMVRTMLQSMMPRVSVGSSRTTGGSTSSSSSSSGDSKAQEAAAQEAQNQIRQRMLQQFQGGGATGGRGGAAGGRGGATGGRGGAAGGRGGRGGR